MTDNQLPASRRSILQTIGAGTVLSRVGAISGAATSHIETYRGRLSGHPNPTVGYTFTVESFNCVSCVSQCLGYTFESFYVVGHTNFGAVWLSLPTSSPLYRNLGIGESFEITAIEGECSESTLPSYVIQFVRSGTSDPDSDGDGLTDSEEETLGTNPNNPDTDGDGLTDSQEVEAGTNPTNADTDSDGLTDSQELQQGTDPNDADSDSDGLTDGEEVELGTSPTNPDSDDDGVPDGTEVDSGSDPLQPDPQTREACMNGGWQEYGFENQGLCIRYVETGQDSRD